MLKQEQDETVSEQEETETKNTETRRTKYTQKIYIKETKNKQK